MPDGKAHATASLIAGVAAGLILCQVDWIGAGLVTLGAWSGVVLSPDNDVDGGFLGHAVIEKIPLVGKIFGFLWRWVWYGYARLIPHRHWVSHLPIISTLIRLGYLYGWVVILSSIYYRELFLPVIPLVMAWWMGGLALSDGIHWFMDLTGTTFRLYNTRNKKQAKRRL